MKTLKKGLATLVLILSTMTHWAYAQEVEGLYVPFETTRTELTPHLEKELKCLALNIYHEAGSEPYEGKLAVAQVSMNRAESGKFPNTICGVVKQKSIWQGATVCQFSWFCTAKSKMVQPLNSINYQESLAIARKVLLEGLELTHLKDALYFHSRLVKPNWGKVRVAQIGNHIFYRDHR